MITPSEFQEKQARRLKGALEDMAKGVQGVTVSPTNLAAAKQDKMKTRLNASIDSGRWASALKAVSLEDWKTKMIDKGINRVATGIDAASDKVINFASQLLPAVQAAQNKVKAMPDVTLEDSISRMNAYTREMAKFHKK